MVSKSSGCKGSQENGSRFFKGDFRRHLRLLLLVEFLDLVDHLKTILVRHLEIKKQKVDRL